MKNIKLSRRELLSHSAIGGGSLSLGLLNPLGMFGSNILYGADATSQNNHLVFIHLEGGYSASFAAAKAFLNNPNFGGITDASILTVGNGLAVHKSFEKFPKSVLAQMATAGILHNAAGHPAARMAGLVSDSKVGALHYLAAGMGGPSSNKLVQAGPSFAVAFNGSYNGVAVQPLTDMKTIIDALGGGEVGPYTPDRLIAAKAMAAAGIQSQDLLQGNPNSLTSMPTSYASAIDVLNKPVQVFDSNKMLADYGINSTLVGKTVASQFAFAELMIRASSNVIMIGNRGVWDNHNDPKMTTVFNKMDADIIPALTKFFTRVYGDVDNNIAPLPEFAGKNIVTVIYGDFVREADNSGHGSGITATVVGPNVKQGSLDQINGSGLFASSTPNPSAFWAYLATILKAPSDTVNSLVNLGGAGTAAGLQTLKGLSKI